ncbi:hypothetical protein CXB51_021847 [Gossypium anomalum]|uniref:Uncharacterized protein n=1 Tax=Gossypium anomalum TaxID=47600 RepID=A0A8J5ZBS5_9ROSI|nr:hypothetical protein CXB51_021847 [Gossypium anomalum]
MDEIEMAVGELVVAMEEVELILAVVKGLMIETTVPVGRVLRCFIRNLPSPPSPLIENYLREVGFWHVANIVGVQVGPKTHQCICGEVETRDAHILSFMWGVYHHFGGRAVIVRVTEVRSIWAGYGRHSRCRRMNQLKYKEYDMLGCTSFRSSENLNIWHVRVPLVSYITIEIHKMDRMLQQFKFLQPIPVALEDPWKTIFALGKEEALANPCRKGMTWPFKSKKNGWQGEPINSTHAITGLNGVSDDAHTTTPSDYAMPSSQKRPQEALSGSLTHFQSPSPYGIQACYAHSSWVKQTHPQSLFYQGGSSSQHPQPEAKKIRNSERNYRPPPCGTDSDLHMH